MKRTNKLKMYLNFLFIFFIRSVWAQKGDIATKKQEAVAESSSDVNLSGVSEDLASIMSIFIFVVISSAFLHFILSKINDKMPISLILFVFGMLLYGILISFDESKVKLRILKLILNIRNIDNSILYYIALPILLYEATQTINWYSFCNFLLAGITLSVVGVLLQVCILGVLFYYTVGLGHKWTFPLSFLLASIMSSTDPVSVLSILGDANTENKMITMFNGESLINDGTSVLLFQFFYLLILGNSNSPGYYILLFIKLLFLSPLMGFLAGLLVIIWMSFVRKFHILQSIISIFMGYLLFFCVEYYLNISGPLSIVCYGLFVKAYGLIAFDMEALEKHNIMLESLSYLSNYIVFTISGILTIGMLRSQIILFNIGRKIFNLLIIYFLLNIARTIMLISFKPVLTYTGYKINYKELLLLIWGGLRGAMVLILGLRLESDKKIEEETIDLVSFYISGSSMLILVVQGFTFDLLYKLLNPYPMSQIRREHLNNTMVLIDRKYQDEIENLKKKWLFKNTDLIIKSNLLVPRLTNIVWNKMGKLKYRSTFPQTTNTHIMLDKDEQDQLYDSYELSGIVSQEAFGRKRKRKTKYINEIDIENLMVIEKYDEVINEELEVEDEENIFIFNENLQTVSQSQYKPLSSSLEQTKKRTREDSIQEDDLKMDGAESDATEDENWHKKVLHNKKPSSLSYTIGTHSDPDLDLPSKKHTLENTNLTDFNLLDNADNKFELKKIDELYIIIFNALSYIYEEMYKDNIIDGKSLLTLNNILNISLDFSVNKLNQRSMLAWKKLLKHYALDHLESSLNIKSDSVYNFYAKSRIDDLSGNIEKMNGFQFEWFVLKSNLQEVASKRLHFIKKSNVSFILDLVLAYIEGHEKLINKPSQLLENILDQLLYDSYLKQINKAKKYVFNLKNKINIKFYHCLMIRTASIMINIKKEVVEEHYANGMLLYGDKKQIIDLLDQELFQISNKTHYVKIIKTILLKIFYLVTFNKKMYTSTNTV